MKSHILPVLLTALLCPPLPIHCFYIPADVAGTLLIPGIMRAGGMSLFRIGRMIGIRANTNHGVHGGPIHHVFPTTYHSTYADHYDRDPESAYDDYSHDDDDDEEPDFPKLHKNVVSGHYAEGTHFHYSQR